MDPDATQPGPPGSAPRHDLDVRPVIAAGDEPFTLIMEAVVALPPDGVLALRSPFDPAPLHRVLGARGFARVTRTLAPGDVETLYWRAGDAPDAEPVTLDVRGLSPPEPMELTLAALERLPAGRELVQLNDRVPAFLLPLLDERGYEYRIGLDEHAVVTTIWRAAR